jgi:hypothetical protein
MVMLRMPDPFAVACLDAEKEFEPAQSRAKGAELGAFPVDDAWDGARALINVDVWLLQVGVVEYLGILRPKDDGQPLAHLGELRMEARWKGALDRVELLGRVVDLGAGLASVMVPHTRERVCDETRALFLVSFKKGEGWEYKHGKLPDGTGQPLVVPIVVEVLLGHHEGGAGNLWHRVHVRNVVEPAVNRLTGGHHLAIGLVSQLNSVDIQR